jgi:hypothetical protein
MLLGLSSIGCSLQTSGFFSVNGGAVAGGEDDGGDASDDARMAGLRKKMANMSYKDIPDSRYVERLHQDTVYPKGTPVQGAIRCGKNPDPKWITDWRSDEVLNFDNLAVWMQARANQTYAADIPAAYKKYRKAYEAFDAEGKKRLDAALAKPSFYERVEALTAAYKQTRDALKAADKTLPKLGQNQPGVLFDISQAIVAEYKKQNATFAYNVGSTNTRVVLGELHASGLRPWGSDDEEQRYFAVTAMLGHAQEYLPPLVSTYEYIARTAPRTKWPFDFSPRTDKPKVIEGPKDAFAELKEAKVKLASYPTSDIEDMKTETKELILKGNDAADAKLVRVHGWVSGIERKDGAVKLELVRWAYDSDQRCTEYGPIRGVDSNGRFYRSSNCVTTAERDTERRFHVTLKELPAQIDEGDSVVVFGDLTDVKAKGTPSKATVDIDVTGRLVGCFSKQAPIDRKQKDWKNRYMGGESGDCKLAKW